MEQEQFLEDNNIILEYVKFKNKKLSGAYLHIEDRDFICLDKCRINNRIEEKCIIEHEISHFQLGTVYTIQTNITERSRIEYRTSKRDVYKMLPYDKLKSFISRNKPNYAYEIAEEFDVTEDLVNNALKIYSIIN